MSDVRGSYDQVAGEYVARIAGELEHKPLDRELLDRFTALTSDLGRVCDLGCGPGHVAAYLHARGARVVGIDLSPVMVEAARRLNPDLDFVTGDLLSLPIGEQEFGGAVALYSLIHVPRERVVEALTEINRVLRPGGLLLVAFHIGDGLLHLDEWWGRRVSVDFVFFRTDEMSRYLDEAGFQVKEVVERDPYPDVEHPSRRAYLLAEKPPSY